VSERLTTFRYSDLQHATNNFSVELGEGAFGSVFRGQLPAGSSSTPIAVKRLDGFQHGDKQFRAEVSTVGMVNRVMNLVRLLGFCAEKTSRLLVYESDTGSFFPCWAAIQVIDGNERSILDQRLEGVADMDELARASRLACWCIQYWPVWFSSYMSQAPSSQVERMHTGVIVCTEPGCSKISFG
jgi:hypothetical protein